MRSSISRTRLCPSRALASASTILRSRSGSYRLLAPLERALANSTLPRGRRVGLLISCAIRGETAQGRQGRHERGVRRRGAHGPASGERKWRPGRPASPTLATRTSNRRENARRRARADRTGRLCHSRIRVACAEQLLEALCVAQFGPRSGKQLAQARVRVKRVPSMTSAMASGAASSSARSRSSVSGMGAAVTCGSHGRPRRASRAP